MTLTGTSGWVKHGAQEACENAPVINIHGGSKFIIVN
jgi:hypothetical protein